VGLHFKHNPAVIKKMIRKMTDTVLDVPPEPEPTPGATETKTATVTFWNKVVDMYFRQKVTYDNSKCALYTVIWSQCSEAMPAKVKSHKDYNDMYKPRDSLTLINVIKGIASEGGNLLAYIFTYVYLTNYVSLLKYYVLILEFLCRESCRNKRCGR
jgi:hypothetical protein